MKIIRLFNRRFLLALAPWLIGTATWAGEISDLRCQVPYRLEVNGILITTWKADFVYRDNATGKEVVEDVKGMPNDRWPMKKKLMLACHGIEVEEIKPSRKRR